MHIKGYKVIKIESFKEAEKAVKYEFSSRASSNYILIKGKKGGKFGEHWHKGTVVSKNPEILFLIEGKVHMICKHVQSSEIQESDIMSPVVIEIFPNWYHTVHALSDVIFLELTSVEDHKADSFDM